MNLEIKSLKGKKFSSNLGLHYCEFDGGYALYNKEKGFLSFKKSNIGEIVKTPYVNSKKVLQSIIDDGGLIHYDDVEWIRDN